MSLEALNMLLRALLLLKKQKVLLQFQLTIGGRVMVDVVVGSTNIGGVFLSAVRCM